MTDPSIWQIQYTNRAAQALRKLDKEVARRVVSTLDRLSRLDHPEQSCKALGGPLKEYWRLRVGNYRVILDIYDDKLVIIVTDIGHRSDIYRNRCRELELLA